MKVEAKALHQAVKNASLFAKKGGWADAVKVEFSAGSYVNFTTCDDYVGICSTLTYKGSPQSDEFFLSPQSVKDLERWLRDCGEGADLELQLHGQETLGIYHYERGDALRNEGFPIIDCPNPEWWGMFDYIMDHVYAFPRAAHNFEISPDRLTQMSRLEPKGDYPIAFGHCEVDGRECVAFKYGPDTHGMIMPLDREALRKAYGDKFKEVVF